MKSDLSRHDEEMQQNLLHWERKPVLRQVYRRFHEMIAAHLSAGPDRVVVELGSGIGNIKEVIPDCIRTDLFPHPWLDRVENAYRLSFAAGSVSDIILFDVFHHLRYPGTALDECRRVLRPGGRAIIFDVCVSLFGLMLFGLFHHEPLGLTAPIDWYAPPGWSPDDDTYYASVANTFRVLVKRGYQQRLSGWEVIEKRRLSAISHVAAGGYSGPQLYPDIALPLMRWLERACDLLPSVFATRLLVVLQKA